MSHSMGLVSGAWACDESRIPSDWFYGLVITWTCVEARASGFVWSSSPSCSGWCGETWVLD